MEAQVARLGFKSFSAALCAATLGLAGTATGEPIKAGGTGAALAHLQKTAKQVGATIDIIVVEGLGSSGANRAVIAGAIDVSISGRPLREAERAAGLVSRPLLRTPFALFTSQPEPIDIASAEIWRLYQNPGVPNVRFGGQPVRIILRPEADSDQAYAKASFAGLEKAYEAARQVPCVPMAQTDQDNADLAEELTSSLTTGTLLQMVSEQRNLRPISLDGIVPSPDTARSGAYRYFKTFYVVHRPNSSETVMSYVTYLFSAQGLSSAEAMGAIVVE